MIIPKVSILIPVYNRESLIGPCIQSAIGQTLADIEIIVVDNASTDRTWEVCKAFARKDSRIRIFRNETNIGPVRNWRRCINESHGVYGKILFSDDIIEPDYLEKTVAYLDDSRVGFVFTSVNTGEGDETRRTIYRFARQSGIFSSSEFIRQALFGGNVPVSPGCAIFRLLDLKNNLLEEIPSPTLNNFHTHGAGPDLLIYLLTAVNYGFIAYVDDQLSYFRIHEGSISTNDKERYLFKCYRQARIWFAEKYLPDNEIGKYFAYEWRLEYKETGKITGLSKWLRNYSQSKAHVSLFDILWVVYFKAILKNKF